MLASGRQARLFARSFRLIQSSPLSVRIASSSTRLSLLRPCTVQISKERLFSSFAHYQQQAAATAQDDYNSEELSSSPQEFTKFDELGENGIIDKRVINTITSRMDIHTMTDVQRMTLNECLDGTDVIAQARTGTGKTLAFLLPIVQRILQHGVNQPSRPAGGFSRSRGEIDIQALIISPTRELAEQIAVEARKIVQGTGLVVQTAVGGTGKSYNLRQIQQQGCHILVGTPGRVTDVLSDPSSGVKMDNIQTFVLDEADRLLDIGFADAIAEIQGYMPTRADRDRQTLMFSATVPKTVVSLVRQTMRPNFKFVRTVDPDEAPTHTNIPQKAVFLRGLENQMPAILEIATQAMEAHRADPENNIPFKAIVYFPSLNEVALATEIFQNLREPSSAPGGRADLYAPHPLKPCQVIQMSSRLTQQQRTANSQAFRRADYAILFSSDVTARGMDFPNVSHVIQVGLPRNSDDYVHRLGRTGRAGKSGQGWLLLNDDERQEYQKKMYHSGIKIDEDKSLRTASLDMTQGAQIPAQTARLMQMAETGVRATPFNMKQATYISLLGVLQQQNPIRAKQTVIDMINKLARFGWGLEKSPSIPSGLIQKLGYYNCDGIEVDDRGRSNERGSSGRGGGRNMGRQGGFDDKDPFGFGGSGRGSFAGSDRRGGRDDDRRGGGRSDDRRGGRDENRRGGFGDRGGSQRGGYGNNGGDRHGRGENSLDSNLFGSRR